MTPDPIVITGAKRTPMGGLQGDLAGLSASQLGATAIRAALQDSAVKPEDIDEVIMGCVLPAGQGQAPARQAALGAGLPQATGCTTVNKMCGSGMKAAMFAHDLLRAGSGDIIVAGGMESMTNAPYLLDKARSGYRLGHGKVIDHMFLDGLEDALASLSRALAATRDGGFAAEIAPATVPGREGERVVSVDEQPAKAKPEKIPTLKPAFRAGGTVTAANSSSISDGAAALVMMRRSEAERRGLTPLATILGHSNFAQAPARFTTAPVGAIRRLLDSLEWKAGDVDLWEINEAFAVVAMIAMRELGLPHERVNIRGGACALGHPIGASGARIMVTLIAALKQQGLKRGIASLCIGGGEATAMAVEVG
jgi:acetyl-CoA C-acetyltransferase